ncbi:hypothetical protein [Archangium sp. Cb G35]|uniref:hypothetical protein n=1 Tax=Archangium sp. Cb G35 TaxID=1920190 RepID=UPI0009F9BB8E|nr:hypothetical protein [Archangium sp. Cb G35]
MSFLQQALIFLAAAVVAQPGALHRHGAARTSFIHHKDMKQLTGLAEQARQDLRELFEKDEQKQKKPA